MTAPGTPSAPGPADWVRRLAPDPADPPPAPASSARTLAEATGHLGEGPVGWAVATGAALARGIIREVPELGGGQAPYATLRMGTEAATLHILLLLADPTAERPIPEETLLGDREFARRRLGLEKVLRGIRVSHAALSRALMSGCQEHTGPAARADEFRRLSETLFAFMDAFSSRMTAEYLAEHDRWLTSGAAAREETVRAILDGRPVAEETARDVLAHRLDADHLAVVAWCDRPAAEAVGDLERTTVDLLHLRGCASVLVLPTGRTTVWAWGELPADRAAAPVPAPGTFAPPADLRFACGSVRPGAAGFRQSHEDALRVARLTELNPDGTGQVTDHPDVALAALLAADLPGVRDFVADQLGGLAQDTAHAAQLRRTLHLYLRSERSLTTAAAQLHVARNTVTYRVKRAQELLGADLTGRLPELLAALEAAERLGPAVLLRSAG